MVSLQLNGNTGQNASLKGSMRWHRGWLLPSRLYLNRKHELNRSNPWLHQFTSSFYVSFPSRVKGTGSRFSACLFIKMLFFCQDTLYRLCEQYDHLVMKAAQYKFLILWSCHNVIKEPICTLTRQSLALDQLKHLQIAVIKLIKHGIKPSGQH